MLFAVLSLTHISTSDHAHNQISYKSSPIHIASHASRTNPRFAVCKIVTTRSSSHRRHDPTGYVVSLQRAHRDRYQIIAQHDDSELICEDTGLPDLPQSKKLIFLQIFQQGRDQETKQRFYAKIMEELSRKRGVGKLFLAVINCASSLFG